MAGNKLIYSGSIYFRVSGLLKAGAIKEQERPLWYDVYKKFPPKFEPAFARPAVEKEIKPIFYHEDIVRGKFTRKYGTPGVHDLLKHKPNALLQRFVSKYLELEKTGKFDSEDAVFKATEESLVSEGVTLERLPISAPPVQTYGRAPTKM